MAKKKKPPAQSSLLGSSVSCPDIENLPLITQAQGQYEVIAPGSVYQPILLVPGQQNIDVGPGKLDRNEERFLRHLINRLYPDGNPPKSEKTPLTWDEKEVWLKRNIEKNSDSFRLRIDESDWFYPDFILWIIDHKSKTQTLGFVDPKGLTMGVKGWSDYKLLSTIYMPHVLELNIGNPIEIENDEWVFRVRGVLVSTSKLSTLVEQDKLYVHDESGQLVSPDEADFFQSRIVFQQEEKNDYIDKILNLLVEDTYIDDLAAYAARAYHEPTSVTPMAEEHYDLLLREIDNAGSESEYISSIIRDYLKKDVSGAYGKYAYERRRGELLKYSKEGLFGLGSEKASQIRDMEHPCKELWGRKSKNYDPAE